MTKGVLQQGMKTIFNKKGRLTRAALLLNLFPKITGSPESSFPILNEGLHLLAYQLPGHS